MIRSRFDRGVAALVMIGAVGGCASMVETQKSTVESSQRIVVSDQRDRANDRRDVDLTVQGTAVIATATQSEGCVKRFGERPSSR